jgi:hypothetical protein
MKIGGDTWQTGRSIADFVYFPRAFVWLRARLNEHPCAALKKGERPTSIGKPVPHNHPRFAKKH